MSDQIIVIGNSPLTCVSGGSSYITVNPCNSSIVVQSGGNTIIESGTRSFLSEDFLAGESIAAYDIVAIIGGLAYKADVNNSAHANSIVGIALTNVGSGSNVEVVTSGRVSNPLWTWDESLPIWLGDSTGEATQTVTDQSNSLYCIEVAKTRSPNTISVDIEYPIFFA